MIFHTRQTTVLIPESCLFPKHIDQEVVEGSHMVVLFLILFRTIVPVFIIAGVYLLNNV